MRVITWTHFYRDMCSTATDEFIKKKTSWDIFFGCCSLPLQVVMFAWCVQIFNSIETLPSATLASASNITSRNSSTTVQHEKSVQFTRFHLDYGEKRWKSVPVERACKFRRDKLFNADLRGADELRTATLWQMDLPWMVCVSAPFRECSARRTANFLGQPQNRNNNNTPVQQGSH